MIRYLALLIAVSVYPVAFAQDGDFPACIDALKIRAREAGLNDTIINNVLAKVNFNPRVIELDRRQPELTDTFHDYLNKRVTAQRVEQGRNLMARHGAFLDKLTAKYGIPPQYLIALWGLETNYGAYTGNTSVLDSLATLACDERRSEFFTLELFEALWLVQNDVIGQAQMQGSWAGAMGNMQFMPSTYRQHAIDADGDGRADMWNSLHDTFTSVARFLDALGWERGYRWGREVKLPKNFPYARASSSNWQPLSTWRDLGVTTTAGNPCPTRHCPPPSCCLPGVTARRSPFTITTRSSCAGTSHSFMRWPPAIWRTASAAAATSRCSRRTIRRYARNW